MPYWLSDDKIQIYYELVVRQSDADVLVLLPGLLGSIATQWQGLVSRLAIRYRLVLVDLRGHGRSGDNGMLIADRMVEDLIGLLDHLGIKTTYFAGYDFGGYLGLMLHLYEPRRISSLMMHATKFYWTKSVAEESRKNLDPDLISERAPNYADKLALDHGASRWRSLARQAGDLTSYLSEHGLTERMASSAQIPILVSVGDRDELVPVQEAFRLSRALNHGRLVVLPGVNHPLASAENPLMLTAMISHFQK